MFVASSSMLSNTQSSRMTVPLQSTKCVASAEIVIIRLEPGLAAVETPVALPYGCVVNLRFLSGSFQFEDDRTESVIAAADRHSGLPYPVAIIEKFLACPVSQCEDILVCFGIIYIFA